MSSPQNVMSGQSEAQNMNATNLSAKKEKEVFMMREGEPGGGLRIPLPKDSTIKYGADTRWVKKDFKKGDMFRCDNNQFGNDPAYGTSKSCYDVAPDAEASSQNSSGTSEITNKNGTFKKMGGDNTAASEPGCIFISNTVVSLDACKSSCISDPACTNINYHVPSGVCQRRRCNNPSRPVGSTFPGWNMYAFFASNPMDPEGSMSSYLAKIKGVGELASEGASGFFSSEGGSGAFSHASEFLGSTVSSFGYILGVIAIIAGGVIIAVFAWKMFMGSSSASMINSAPSNIIR